jgi:hypothetical protein
VSAGRCPFRCFSDETLFWSSNGLLMLLFIPSLHSTCSICLLNLEQNKSKSTYNDSGRCLVLRSTSALAAQHPRTSARAFIHCCIIASFLSASSAISLVLPSKIILSKISSEDLSQINGYETLDPTSYNRSKFYATPVMSYRGTERQNLLRLPAKDMNRIAYCNHGQLIHSLDKAYLDGQCGWLHGSPCPRSSLR